MMPKRGRKREKMLSVPHLVIIFLVALLVFGPEKLPELARKLGKATAEFKRATDGLRAGFEEHMRELEREASLAAERKRPAENTMATPRSEAASVTTETKAEEPNAATAGAGEAAAPAESEAAASHPPK
jgi:TatA/E family protein of Tat protein translocase